MKKMIGPFTQDFTFSIALRRQDCGLHPPPPPQVVHYLMFPPASAAHSQDPRRSGPLGGRGSHIMCEPVSERGRASQRSNFEKGRKQSQGEAPQIYSDHWCRSCSRLKQMEFCPKDRGIPKASSLKVALCQTEDQSRRKRRIYQEVDCSFGISISHIYFCATDISVSCDKMVESSRTFYRTKTQPFDLP